MKRLILLSLAVLCMRYATAQDSTITPASENNSVTVSTAPLSRTPVTNSQAQPVYKTSFKTDAPILVGGIGLTYLGLRLVQDKKSLTAAEVASKSKSDVPFFDRSSVGWYSAKANDDSYIPFYFSFGAPVVMSLINKNERERLGQVLIMYTETMAITGSLFTIAAGVVQRSRPLVYGDKATLDQRMSKNNQRSFYAGHTASSAAATFFAAKVFQDLNPDSKLKTLVWVIAAAVPASVGYMRYKAGMHFLSDNLLGYAVGAATGILVPQFHKNKKQKSNFSLTPAVGSGYQGFSLSYHF